MKIKIEHIYILNIHTFNSQIHKFRMRIIILSGFAIVCGVTISRLINRIMCRDKSFEKLHASCIANIVHKKATMYIVVDIDETIVYARQGSIIPRYGYELLKKLATDFNIELTFWTAGNDVHAKSVLTQLDLLPCIDHIITRNTLGWNSCTKNLLLLHDNLDRVIIIDNSESAIQINGFNGLVVPNFYGNHDIVMLELYIMLVELCLHTKLTVADYIFRNTIMACESMTQKRKNAQ